MSAPYSPGFKDAEITFFDLVTLNGVRSRATAVHLDGCVHEVALLVETGEARASAFPMSAKEAVAFLSGDCELRSNGGEAMAMAMNIKDRITVSDINGAMRVQLDEPGHIAEPLRYVFARAAGSIQQIARREAYSRAIEALSAAEPGAVRS